MANARARNCDNCGKLYNAVRVSVSVEGRTRSVDLCANCRVPIEKLLAKAKPTRTPVRMKVTPLDEIERRKQE